MTEINKSYGFNNRLATDKGKISQLKAIWGENSWSNAKRMEKID